MPNLDATSLALGVISFAQAAFIAIIGYFQWRSKQRGDQKGALEDRRVALAEVKADTDQNLMAVFQSQLTAAMERIDKQDRTISELRDEINLLKIEMTDLEIQNRKLKAVVGDEVA